MALEYPRAYIFEADPGSGASASISGMTNGNSYTVIRLENDSTRMGHETTHTEFPTGKGHFFKKKKWKPYEHKINGFIKETAFSSTITAATNVLQYIPKNWGDRTSPDWLVVVHGSGEYEKWPNEDGDLVDVARGYFKDVHRERDRDEGNLYYIRGTFIISWT